jgi:hypothetical protein
MAKWRFSNRLASDEITTPGYRALTFAKCTTIMVVELIVMSGLDPLENRWFGLVMVWFGMIFGVACVEPCDP